jgi:hypothetical protein
MLSKQFKVIYSKLSFKRFSNKLLSEVNNLVDCLDKEIKSAESSYTPPEENEMESFLNTNRWVLFQQVDSIHLGLKKSKDEFDVSVRFSSKPPELATEQKGPAGIKILFILKNRKVWSIFILQL